MVDRPKNEADDSKKSRDQSLLAAAGMQDGTSMALDLANKANAHQFDESQLGLLKTSAMSALHSGIQEPITGVSQFFGSQGPQLFKAEPQAEFGSKSWFAQTIGSGVGMVAPFLLTEGATSSLMKNRGAIATFVSERVPMTKGLMRPLMTGAEVAAELSPRARIMKSAVDGALYGFVFTPSHDPEKSFWGQRLVNAGSGGLTFATQAAVSHGMMTKWGKMGADVNNPAFMHSWKGIPLRVGTNMVGGAFAGAVSAESTSLLSGNGFAKKEDVIQSVASFVVTGGALDAFHIAKEIRAEKAKGNAAPKVESTTYGGDLARRVETHLPTEAAHAKDIHVLGETVRQTFEAYGRKAEAQQVLRATESILTAPKLAVELTPAERVGLAKQILNEALNPKIIDQGRDLTCGPAVVQEMLLHTSPGKYAEALAAFVTTGKFKSTGPRGTIEVDLSPEMLSKLPPEYRDVMKPDAQARRSLQAAAEPGKAPVIDGERTYASQLTQLLAANIHTQNGEAGSRSIYVKGAADPLRVIDTGERLFKLSDKPQLEMVVGQNGKPEIGPAIKVTDLQPIWEAMSGSSSSNNPFVLINTERQLAANQGKAFQTIDQLNGLMMESRGPVIIQVDPTHPLFRRGSESRYDVAHAVLAEVMRDGTGAPVIDASTGTAKVQIFDQYGRARDLTGEKAVSVADLFDATRNLDGLQIGASRDGAMHAAAILHDRARNDYFKERLEQLHEFLADRQQIPKEIEGGLDQLTQLARRTGFPAQEIVQVLNQIDSQLQPLRRAEAQQRAQIAKQAAVEVTKSLPEKLQQVFPPDAAPTGRAASEIAGYASRVQKLFEKGGSLDPHAVDMLNKLVESRNSDPADVAGTLEYIVARQELHAASRAIYTKEPGITELRHHNYQALRNAIEGELATRINTSRPAAEWMAEVGDKSSKAIDLAEALKVVLSPGMLQRMPGSWHPIMESIRNGSPTLLNAAERSRREFNRIALWDAAGTPEAAAPTVQPVVRRPQIFYTEARRPEPPAPRERVKAPEPTVKRTPAPRMSAENRLVFDALEPPVQARFAEAVKGKKLVGADVALLEGMPPEAQFRLLQLANQHTPERGAFPIGTLRELSAPHLEYLATVDGAKREAYYKLSPETISHVIDHPAAERAHLEALMQQVAPGTFARIFSDPSTAAARLQWYKDFGIGQKGVDPAVTDMLVRNIRSRAQLERLGEFFERHKGDPHAAEAALALTREPSGQRQVQYQDLLSHEGVTPSMVAAVAKVNPSPEHFQRYLEHLSAKTLTPEQFGLAFERLTPEARRVVFADLLPMQAERIKLPAESFDRLLHELADGKDPRIVRAKANAELYIKDPATVAAIDKLDPRVADKMADLMHPTSITTAPERAFLSSWIKSENIDLVTIGRYERTIADLKDTSSFNSEAYFKTVEQLRTRGEKSYNATDAAEIAAIIHLGNYEAAKTDGSNPAATKKAEDLHQYVLEKSGRKSISRSIRASLVHLELAEPGLFETRPRAPDVVKQLADFSADQLVAFGSMYGKFNHETVPGVDVGQHFAEALAKHSDQFNTAQMRRLLRSSELAPEPVKRVLAEATFAKIDSLPTNAEKALLLSKAYGMLLKDNLSGERHPDLIQQLREKITSDMLEDLSTGKITWFDPHSGEKKEGPSALSWYADKAREEFSGLLNMAGIKDQAAIMGSIDSIAAKRTGQHMEVKDRIRLLEALDRAGLKTPEEKAKAIDMALGNRARFTSVSGLTEVFKGMTIQLGIGRTNAHYVYAKSNGQKGMAPAIDTLFIGDSTPGAQLAYHYFKQAQTHFNIFRVDQARSTPERMVISDATGKQFAVTHENGQPKANWLNPDGTLGEARQVPRFVVFDQVGQRSPELAPAIKMLEEADHAYVPRMVVGEKGGEPGFTGGINMFDLAKAISDPTNAGMDALAKKLVEHGKDYPKSLDHWAGISEEALHQRVEQALRTAEYDRTVARLLNKYVAEMRETKDSQAKTAKQIEARLEALDKGINYRTVPELYGVAQETKNKIEQQVGKENMKDVYYVILEVEGSAHFIHELYRQANPDVPEGQFKTEAELRAMAERGELKGKKLVLLDDNFDFGAECMGKLNIANHISKLQHEAVGDAPADQMKGVIIANLYAFDHVDTRAQKFAEWRKEKNAPEGEFDIDYLIGSNEKSVFATKLQENGINTSALGIDAKEIEGSKFSDGTNKDGAAELWPHLMPNNSAPMVVSFARDLGHYPTRINSRLEVYKPLTQVLPEYLRRTTGKMTAQDRAEIMLQVLEEQIKKNENVWSEPEKRAARHYADSIREHMDAADLHKLIAVADYAYPETDVQRRPAVAQLRADVQNREALDFSVTDRESWKHNLNYEFKEKSTARESWQKPTVTIDGETIIVDAIRCKNDVVIMEYTTAEGERRVETMTPAGPPARHIERLLSDLRSADIPGASGNAASKAHMLAAYLDRLAAPKATTGGARKQKQAAALTPEQAALQTLKKDLAKFQPLDLGMKTAHRQFELRYSFEGSEVVLNIGGKNVIITGIELNYKKGAPSDTIFLGENGKPLPREVASAIEQKLHAEMASTNLRQYVGENAKSKIPRVHLTALYLDRLAKIQNGEVARSPEAAMENKSLDLQEPGGINPERDFRQSNRDPQTRERQVDWSKAQKIESGEHTLTSGVYEISGNARVKVSGDAVVRATGESVIYASDTVQVDGFEKAKIYASGKAVVKARDFVEVEASGDATVYSRAAAKIRATDNVVVSAAGASEIFLSGKPHANMRGTARAVIEGEATAWLLDHAQAEARGKSRVLVEDNASVTASESAQVEAKLNAQVRASGKAEVTVWDKANVEAFENATAIVNDRASATLNDSAHADASNAATVTVNGNKATVTRGGRARVSIRELTADGQRPATVAVDSPIARAITEHEGAVAQIFITDPTSPAFVRDKSGGTGFFVDSEGHMATAYHVVRHATGGIEVAIGNKRYKARIVEVDPTADVALLKVDSDAPIPSKTPELALDAQAGDHTGADVFILGRTPQNQQLTVSPGTVSGTKKLSELADTTQFKHDDLNMPLIDFTSYTDRGNSGSPLFRATDGKIIGVLTKGKFNAPGSLAASLERIQRMLTDMRSGGDKPSS